MNKESLMPEELVSVKLALFAADQIAAWAALLIKARQNTTMTAEESKAAVAAVQAEAAALGAEWDALDAADD